MSLSLDAYRTKLINKVSTCSTENVQRFINTAVKTLERRNVNGYIVVRFIDKMIIQLEQQTAHTIPSEQFQNIISTLMFLKKKREDLHRILP